MQRSCTMGKKDINRLKVILVEQKHTARGGGGRTSKTRPCNRIEMVYQYPTAKFWQITSSG